MAVNAGPAALQAPSWPVILIISVPGLQADDLRSDLLPAFSRLAQEGAAGWMNVRSSAASDDPHDRLAAGYAALAAGTPADARALSGEWMPVDVAGVEEGNVRMPHVVPVASLGQLAREAGLKLAVIGDTDDTRPHPDALLLAMDRRGRIDYYAPSSVPDVREPFGLRAELSAYVEPAPATLTVWEFGDVLRARRYESLCFPEVAQRHVAAALRRLDALISKRYQPWLDRMKRSGAPFMAWILSPAPSPRRPSLDAVTPVLVHGSDVPRGLLLSPSTRQPGLITNFDLVPTVARFLNVTHRVEGFGRPVQFRPGKRITVGDWAAMHEGWYLQASAQSQLGGNVRIRLAWLVALLAVLWLAVRLYGQLTEAPWVVPAAAACLAPIIPQVLSGFATPMPVWAGVVVLMTSAGVFGLLGARARTRGQRMMGVVCAVLWVAITLDMLAGSRHLARAWLGPSLMVGIRYYGIGNEMAGAWMAALVGAVSLVPAKIRYAVGALLAALSAVLAVLPSGGANLGASVGMVAAAVAFVVATMTGRKRLITFVGLAMLAAGILISLVLLTDYGPAASHIGRAVASPASVGEVAVRKIAVNLRLIVTTRWPLVILLGLAVLYTLWREIRTDWDRRLAAVLLVGTLALLLANDSGVVAAGVCLSIAAPAFVLMTCTPRTEPAQPQRVGDHGDGR